MSKPAEVRRVNRKSDTKRQKASCPTLADKIADVLREGIIDCTFEAGVHLHQAALAKKMGVSSIPFREAIRLLESEGFVELVPFKGARVTGLTREEASGRAQIAFALESHALELTLPTLTREDLDRAAELAGRIYPIPDVRTWYARTGQLLRILYGADRWPHLFDQIMRNRITARRYTELLVRKTIEDEAWTNQWAAGHFPQLIELLRKGNLAGAKALHRERLEGFVEQLLPLIEPKSEKGAGRRALRNVKKRKAPLKRR
jgi:DNA-binding GntR family transcriptional regulator